MIRDAQLARRLWSSLEPVHAVTYFHQNPSQRSPTPATRDSGWVTSPARRADGSVGPEIVFATFYNFSMAHIRRALPDGWTFAPPSAALEVRREGSVAALQRAFAHRELAESVATAAMLARAGGRVRADGRPHLVRG